MQAQRIFVFLMATLLVLPAGAATIANGIDAWVTPGNGSSFVDFGDDPIPAGFFCPGSAPFTGVVQWKGVPLASKPANALLGADTVVQRLDDLVFDEKGRAVTRLQMRALSMESLEPIRTRCGDFAVKASLAAVQPVTTMEVVEEASGRGSWSATLAINTRLTFTPVQGVTVRPLVLERGIELRVDRALWSDQPAEGALPQTLGGFILVDTDGDQRPDTFLPGVSAFFASGEQNETARPECYLQGGVCHDSYGYGHCHCTQDPYWAEPLSD